MPDTRQLLGRLTQLQARLMQAADARIRQESRRLENLAARRCLDVYKRQSEAYVYSVGSAAYYLGEQILAGLNYATGLPNRGVRTNPSLYVLRRTDVYKRQPWERSASTSTMKPSTPSRPMLLILANTSGTSSA